MPTQLVAPSAVRMADAIEATSCTMNLMVSFLLIVVCFGFFNLFCIAQLHFKYSWTLGGGLDSADFAAAV